MISNALPAVGTNPKDAFTYTVGVVPSVFWTINLSDVFPEAPAALSMILILNPIPLVRTNPFKGIVLPTVDEGVTEVVVAPAAMVPVYVIDGTKHMADPAPNADKFGFARNADPLGGLNVTFITVADAN
jgi:hypothetical protein